jgi:hypothetical protein
MDAQYDHLKVKLAAGGVAAPKILSYSGSMKEAGFAWGSLRRWLGGKRGMSLLSVFLFENKGIFFKLLVCFFFKNDHKEKAQAPGRNTRHLNPGLW